MKYKLILCPEGSPHWAKLVDENDKFIQFMSDPTKENYKKECEKKLKIAYEIDATHRMVKSFILQFNKKRFLSTKQMNWLNNFIEAHQ